MDTHVISHLYDSYDEAARVVAALEAHGVARERISLVANSHTARDAAFAAGRPVEPSAGPAGASLGTLLGGGAGLLAGLGALAIPGIGPVVAAGWLIATLTGAGVGAGAGGLLGSLMHAGVHEDHAHLYAEGVRRGATLVSVQASALDDAGIEDVMGSSPSRIAPAALRRGYESDGWTSHDTTAGAMTANEVNAARSRLRSA